MRKDALENLRLIGNIEDKGSRGISDWLNGLWNRKWKP